MAILERIKRFEVSTKIMNSTKGNKNKSKLKIDDFSNWTSGDLLQNIVRGPFAEWLVHNALDIDPGRHRDPWAQFDVSVRGKGLEIKAAAYFQRWEQNKPKITFSIPINQRNGAGFIFCLLGKEDDWITRREPDPLDMTEWCFWVVANNKLPKSKTIGLNPLKKLFGKSIQFNQIHAEVNLLIDDYGKPEGKIFLP